MKRSSVVLGLVVVALNVVGSGFATDFNSQVFGYEEWLAAVEALEIDRAEVVFPFVATPEMTAWAEEKLSHFSTAAPEVRLQALQQAFFDPGEFEFDYEQTRTLTAEQAFSARHGNCMSFTSLFVATSRSIGIPTFLVAVRRQPEVERDAGLVVVNRHVVAGFRTPTKIFIYDFYFTTSTPYLSRRVIDDLAASAIYHTNIGGLKIREGDYHAAIRQLEVATTLEPDWAPAWVNSGVAHGRLNQPEAAFAAYQRALVAEPGNSSALVNLAKLYLEQGREEEAETAMRAAAEGTRNPFTLIAMADADMVRGRYDDARQYLRRARWWYGKEPEVYDALSRLAQLEGDEQKAEKHRARAAELRATSAD
jgi:Flp pilus assembly protein TadD